MLRNLVVAKVVKEPEALLDLPDGEARDVKQLASGADADDLSRLYHGFSQGFDEVVRSERPRMALEMLLVRLARRPPLLPIDEFVARLAALGAASARACHRRARRAQLNRARNDRRRLRRRRQQGYPAPA